MKTIYWEVELHLLLENGYLRFAHYKKGKDIWLIFRFGYQLNFFIKPLFFINSEV